MTVSTDLPLRAARACRLAQRTAMFIYIARPFVGVRGELPEEIPEDIELSGRLTFFGLPTWRHSLRLIEVSDTQLRSREHGGPVRSWRHKLLFEPTSERACRYTDEIEIEAGPLTPIVWLFAALFYRHRQRRWREVARLIALADEQS